MDSSGGIGHKGSLAFTWGAHRGSFGASLLSATFLKIAEAP
jgi:hypothetical protein